jgi:hypothetical protein
LSVALTGFVASHYNPYIYFFNVVSYFKPHPIASLANVSSLKTAPSFVAVDTDAKLT